MESPFPPLTPSFSSQPFRQKSPSPVTPLLSHPCASLTPNPFKITSLRKNHRGVPPPFQNSHFGTNSPRTSGNSAPLRYLFSEPPQPRHASPWSTHRASAIISAYHDLTN